MSLGSSLPYFLPTHSVMSLILHLLASRYSVASYIPARVILKIYSSHHITLFKKSLVGMELLSQELLKQQNFPLLMFLPGEGSMISCNVLPYHFPLFTHFSFWLTEGGNSLSHLSHRKVTLTFIVYSLSLLFFRE